MSIVLGKREFENRDESIFETLWHFWPIRVPPEAKQFIF